MRFEYMEPTTIEEAVGVLVEYNGKAKVISGGTDLVVQMRHKTICPGPRVNISPALIVDISRIPGFDKVEFDEQEGVRIGALTTIRTIEKSPEIHENYPAISQAASKLASVAIRNQATLGGNICNASPAADMPPALIGQGAKVKIVGPEGERIVALEDFFTGPGSTVLKLGELLVEIHVPVPAAGTRGVYLKHAIRGSIDCAIVGVGTVSVIDSADGVCQDIKITIGAVGPTPMRAYDAEGMLRGKRIDEGLIEKSAAAASAEARPISDVRASAEYRNEMVKVLTRNALRQVTAVAGVN